MGLRSKLGIALLLFSLTLLGISAQVIQGRVLNGYAQTERDAAHQSLGRLLNVLEAQIDGLAQNTNEWSSWSELYRYMKSRDPGFVKDNLGPMSVSNSHIDFVEIRDTRQQVVKLAGRDSVEAPPAVTQFLDSESDYVQAYLQNSATENTAQCGLGKLHDKVTPTLLCNHPILDSDGKGQSRGRIVMLRLLDDTMMKTIIRQTQLQFHIETIDDPNAPPPSAEEAMAPLSFLGKTSAPQLSVNKERLRLTYPLHGQMFGQRIAWLHLDYPRTLFANAQETVHRSFVTLALLIISTTLLMMYITDRLVVKRLSQLQGEVSSATQDPGWTARVSPQGNDEVGKLAMEVNELLGVIQSQVGLLHTLSHTDTLTGLANRRCFDERLRIALQRHAREERPLSLILIDVDNFKKYNDRYGHPAGDVALSSIAEATRSGVHRATDLPARIGGEEFVVLLEDTDLHGAYRCVEKIQQCLAEMAIPHEGNPPGIMTFSAGIAVQSPGDTAESLYQRADKGLYMAKEQGRNRAIALPADVPALEQGLRPTPS